MTLSLERMARHLFGILTVNGAGRGPSPGLISWHSMTVIWRTSICQPMSGTASWASARSWNEGDAAEAWRIGGPRITFALTMNAAVRRAIFWPGFP